MALLFLENQSQQEHLPTKYLSINVSSYDLQV